MPSPARPRLYLTAGDDYPFGLTVAGRELDGAAAEAVLSKNGTAYAESALTVQGSVAAGLGEAGGRLSGSVALSAPADTGYRLTVTVTDQAGLRLTLIDADVSLAAPPGG